MEPQIQYVKSADGTNIAVNTMGEGRPLILVPAVWIVSMDGGRHLPEQEEAFERLAQKRLVVRYDNRGQGLSERDVTDFSMEARVADLAAVVSSLDADQFDIYTISNSTPVALAFAAEDDRVRRLVISTGSVRNRDFKVPEQRRAIAGLIEIDWPLYVRTLCLQGFGWTEIGRRVAESSIESMSPETFSAAVSAAARYDATEFAPKVHCPTLVIFRRQETALPIEAARTLAATIPGARLVIADAESPLVLGGTAYREIVESFIDETEEPSQGKTSSGTAIILFADIVDSTALTERLGDAAFRDKARALDEAMRAAIRSNGGTAVDGKTLGDGVLAVFASAREAITCARVCHEAATAAGLSLHAGIHAGDVIREADNVYGGSVNIAARVAAASAAGETLVSGTVRDLARTSAGVTFENRGEQALKGIDDPVRLFKVNQSQR